VSTDVVFVGDPCCDHSASSGYHQVCAIFPDAGWLAERALVEGSVVWHRRPAETAVPARPVFHLFYGDFSRAAAVLRRRFPDAAIVSTIHRPVRRVLDEPAGRAALRDSDAVITVSAVQARTLADFGFSRPVHVIPHGVWSGAFRPLSEPSQPRHHILLVGNHLRDWPAAGRVVDLVAEAGVRSVVVGAQDRIDGLRANPMVQVLDRVSERDLLLLYDGAAALLLPLKDATASNALLEAMASGCPVVCPRATALVEDYIGDTVDVYDPKDLLAAADHLVGYVRDPDRRASRSRVMTERAAAFDWDNIRQRYAMAYDEIQAATRPSEAP